MMASSEALKSWGIHNAHSKSTTMCSRRKSRRPFDIGGRLAAYFPPHGSLPPVHFRSGRLALAGITTAGRMSVSCPHLDAGITGVDILQQYMCTLTTVGGGTRGEGKICRTTALRYQMLVGNSSGLAVSRTISKVNCSGITICSLILEDFQWFSLFFSQIAFFVEWIYKVVFCLQELVQLHNDFQRFRLIAQCLYCLSNDLHNLRLFSLSFSRFKISLAASQRFPLISIAVSTIFKCFRVKMIIFQKKPIRNKRDNVAESLVFSDGVWYFQIREARISASKALQ